MLAFQASGRGSTPLQCIIGILFLCLVFPSLYIPERAPPSFGVGVGLINYINYRLPWPGGPIVESCPHQHHVCGLPQLPHQKKMKLQYDLTGMSNWWFQSLQHNYLTHSSAKMYRKWGRIVKISLAEW